jgi:hypothetical protein
VTFVMFLHVNGCWCCGGHERNSLFHFKVFVHDSSHQILKSWHGFNYCEWNGIQCHPHTHHVIRLDLHASEDALDDGMSLSNQIGDVLSPLFNLEHLEHLDLNFNDFFGVPIPIRVPKLTSLCYLDLAQDRFSGDVTPDIGNISTS